MLRTRIIVTLLAIFTVAAIAPVVRTAAGQGAANNGPVLGKWAFTGKDNTGLVWSGTLTIEKLDPSRFDANKYHSLCSLEVESTDPNKGTVGVEAPCEWHPDTRTVSFGNSYPAAKVYSAVLSADGKALTQGKWTEKKIVAGQAAGIERSGNWSAKLLN